MSIGKSISKKRLKKLCCIVYFFSYIARQNYSAVLTEIIDDLNVSKSVAGIAVMGSFAAYGVFQIISGIFGDKIKPEKIIFIGLFGSSVVNLLVCMFPDICFMNVIWCVNGAFQSLIWPPLVRVIIENIGENEYSGTVVRVTQASYGGTVFVYLFVPAVIYFLNWRFVFAISGLLAMAFSFVWMFETKNIHGENEEGTIAFKKEEKKLDYKKLFAIGFIPIVISTLIAGFIRDGISTWMPTYISEVYNISSFSSILTGAIIPVCCALFLDVLNYIGEKIDNELKTASIYFALAFGSCLVLYIGFSKLPLADVALMSLITVCVHGVNLMLICNVPKRFAKYGKSSTVSGILNSAVYAGSAISAYGTGALATGAGWNKVALVWSIVVLVAFFLCFFWMKTYKKHIR